MALMIDSRVAELLCSRICHDLISPVGAINNGIELIEELGGRVVDEAIGLIDTSARKMSGHLQFFRMSYGFAGGHSMPSFEDVRGLIEGILEGGKIGLDWPDRALPEVAPAPGCGKLLLNMVALAAEGLPRGGTLGIGVSSLPNSHRLKVAARGTNGGLSGDLRAALDPEADVDSLTARTVHAYFTAVLAKRLGTRVEITASPDGFDVTATPTAEP